MKRKRYNDAFRKKIVDLYRSGKSVNDLHREYEVSEVTIYKWIKVFSAEEEPVDLTPLDITAMQTENIRLKQEIEILKKAMTIFAKK